MLPLIWSAEGHMPLLAGQAQPAELLGWADSPVGLSSHNTAAIKLSRSVQEGGVFRT